jgi:CRP-like cAMP-binding protein
MNLGETAIFAGLNADALAQIALQLHVRHLQPNELLFTQGEHGIHRAWVGLGPGILDLQRLVPPD